MFYQKTVMKSILLSYREIIISIIACLQFPSYTRSQEILGNDIDTFVRAHLLIITPGKASYSGFGHCGIRLQCPSEKLDYCYTMEMETEIDDYIKFFAGKAPARVLVIPTAVFISPYRVEGRGITQYELNLSPREKQLLWKNLDEELTSTSCYNFNFTDINCVSFCMMMINRSLIEENILYNKLPSYMKEDNGTVIRQIMKEKPWYEYLYILLFGIGCDETYAIEHRMSPETVPVILRTAKLVNDSGEERPIFKARANILSQKSYPGKIIITPQILFGFILLFFIIITLINWKIGYGIFSKFSDSLLAITQTFVGLTLLYTSLIANVFGTHWNWYIIPYFPIPIFILLMHIIKKDYKSVLLAFGIVLVLFIAFTPFSSQLDITHQLFVTTLAVRYIYLYIYKKQLNSKSKNNYNKPLKNLVEKEKRTIFAN